MYVHISVIYLLICLKLTEKKKMAAIIEATFPSCNNELSQINKLYYIFKTLETVPIVS